MQHHTMDLVKREGEKFFAGDTPHLASGVVFTVAFSLFLIYTLIVCIRYHQWWWLGSWGVGLVLEVTGYAGRIWYTKNDTSRSAYIMELVCITVAPCFLMAGIYYILAQLVLIYGTKYSYLKPMQYSLIFIICDWISILVQAAGGGVAAGESSSNESTSLGSNIMVGGLAFQVFTITIFQYLWYSFLYKVYKAGKLHGDSKFNPQFAHVRNRRFLTLFFIGISITVILIYTRSIYRLIENSMGFVSRLSTQEIYFDLLEGMLVALSGLIMCFCSPGPIYGRDAHLKLNKNAFKDPFEQEQNVDDSVSDAVNSLAFSSNDEREERKGSYLFNEESPVSPL